MKNGDVKSLLPMMAEFAKKLKPYVGIILFVFFTGTYAFMVYQINSLSNPYVDPNEATAQAKSIQSPHIDKAAAEQLLSLKDNHVSVQTLFQQGRSNPFQE